MDQVFNVEFNFNFVQMKDPHLLPYILPNVFSIAAIVSPQQFASLVLPSLKPLFTIKEPPQNMLTLLDNLNTLQEKTEKAVFRERTSEPPFMLHRVSVCASDVLPLVYNALDSEHATVRHTASFLFRAILSHVKVQERALGVVPGLCESIDYAEVQAVLFPRVAVRFF
jgi:SCY1-like protein 2